MIPRIDTGCVTDAAEDLRAMGGSVAENTDAMVAAWAGLRAEGVYVAPEAETVYGLLDPAVAAAGEVESALGGAADALDVFAEELEEIKPGLEELRAEAAAFRARALSGVDEPASKSPVFVPSYGAGSFRSGEGAEDKQWWESGRLCEENSKLLARINDQVIRIVNAENACVNALHDLIPECFVQQPTDLTGDVLDQLGDLPWGGPSEYQSKNCVESAVLGLCDAIVDMVAGAGSLVAGYDPRTGEFGNWDVTGQTWAGLGNLGLSLLAMVPAPVPAASVAECARGTGADNQATRFIREKEHDLWNTVAGMVNIDPAADDPFAAWKKDGVRSAVSAGVNIGTFFVPGAEVGGAMKGAGLAGKAGRMALRGLGAFADTAIPGGSFAVKAGEAGLKAADAAAHAAEGAGLVSRAARAIENGALHNPSLPDPGRAGGLPVKDGPGLDLSGASAGKAPPQADVGAGQTRRGLDGLQDPAGTPDMPDSARAGAPDLGEGAARHGTDTAAGAGRSAGNGPETGTGEVSARHGDPDASAGGMHSDPDAYNRSGRNGTGTPHEVDARGRDIGGSGTREDTPAKHADGEGNGASDNTEGDHRQTDPEQNASKPAYTREEVRQALEAAPRDEHGVPLDHRTGQPLLLENVRGDRGWIMHWDPDAEMWLAENRGNGYPNGLPPKGEPNSYGYDANGNRMPYANHRPSYDPGDQANGIPSQEERVFNAAKDENGDVYVTQIDESRRRVEWEPGQPHNDMEKGWDMGHKPGKEYAKMRDKYLNHEYSPDPIENERLFLEDYRNPDNYIPQDPMRNRSHMDEIP
ncbi:GH-E family nuclease [Propionibacterium australiense]|nr:GH-E family nuclease [Propionibacterium australiense]